MQNNTFRSLADQSFQAYKLQRLLLETAENQELSYADGYELIQMTSVFLQLQGIRKGDMVLTYTPLTLESVVLCWACLYSGVVFIPVDHNWPREMMQFIMAETAPKLILTDAERGKSFPGMNFPGILLLAGNSKASTSGTPFFDWLSSWDRPESTIPAEVYPGDLGVILYTSGSTGPPKGVMLSQQALFNSGKLISTHFRWKSDDLFMNLGDLHSMSGLRNTCFAPLHAGSSSVIASPEERNNILLTIELIRRSGITYLGVAPTVIRQMNILFSESRKNKVSTLKAVMCTGGPLSKEQLQLFWNYYGIPVLNYYGLTETAGICSGHTNDTFNPTDNSIGPASGAELLILPCTEEGYEEDTGELLVRSDNLMSGYFKREEQTAQVLKEGCFCTGDIVRRREDGCFELLGRKRNIVKNIHSELIYLEEIESALESYPFIREAATCPYSRLEEDEKIVAFVALLEHPFAENRELISDIKKFLEVKVGKNRMPWCFYIEEQLPRSTAGKIQRKQLSELLNGYLQANRTGHF